MRYHLLWRQLVLDDLARSYLDALDEGDEERSDRIADTIPAVTSLLSEDPLGKGESRTGYLRVVFVGLATVFYETVHDEGIVIIDSIVFPRGR